MAESSVAQGDRRKAQAEGDLGQQAAAAFLTLQNYSDSGGLDMHKERVVGRIRVLLYIYIYILRSTIVGGNTGVIKKIVGNYLGEILLLSSDMFATCLVPSLFEGLTLHQTTNLASLRHKQKLQPWPLDKSLCKLVKLPESVTLVCSRGGWLYDCIGF